MSHVLNNNHKTFILQDKNGYLIDSVNCNIIQQHLYLILYMACKGGAAENRTLVGRM